MAAAVAAPAYALSHQPPATSHQPEQARQALAYANSFMDRRTDTERADTWLTHGEQSRR
ncbi:hypothetical protein ACFV7R_44080 [Streptomyces sp. NPDC059866]|uniref:hypothetical protein n=1 Tax=Streptomyces sp. NPDC059866 TaxID=3346978 RepID=UPI0036579364